MTINKGESRNMEGKDAKEKFDEAVKVVAETAKTTKGKIVAIIILVIIVLNTFWNMMENKITTELQSVRADLGTLSTRLAEVEEAKGETIDLDAIKAEVQSFKTSAEAIASLLSKTNENFGAKLNAIVQLEEAKLESLSKEVENQKAYIEGLKKLLPEEKN
jgi:hydroxyethylthiazole kinase-like sugar kinase family protein